MQTRLEDRYIDLFNYKIIKITFLCLLGLVYLRPRLVSWAYRRGNKSLVENMKKTITDSKMQTNVAKIIKEDKT